nr:polysaccharide pyruvyl transferase family protein [Ancylobacter koreensis]
MVRLFRRYHIVFDIGEGDSFTDLYGPRRFIVQMCTKTFTVLAGVPLVIAPQTLGPFRSFASRRAATWILKRCRSIYTRDASSATLAGELGVAATDLTDVAFALPYDAATPAPSSVGLNVSGLLYSGGYDRSNQFGLSIDYPAFVARVVEMFRTKGASVHLVAHVIAPDNEVEDDYRACEKVKALYADDPAVVVAPRFTSPMDAKSGISGFGFFVGSRMHATIAAVSAGVPTVPVAYSKKFAPLFEGIGYPFTLDARSATIEELLEAISTAYDARAELAAKAQAAAQAARTRLDIYRDRLKDELRDARRA